MTEIAAALELHEEALEYHTWLTAKGFEGEALAGALREQADLARTWGRVRLADALEGMIKPEGSITRTFQTSRGELIETSLSDEEAIEILQGMTWNSFAVSLVENWQKGKARKKGSPLSPRQWPWVHKLANEQIAREEARKAKGLVSNQAKIRELRKEQDEIARQVIDGEVDITEIDISQVVKIGREIDRLKQEEKESKIPSISFAKIPGLFKHALSTGHKHPKITLDMDQGRIRLGVAGARSKYPGSIHITDGRPFGQNTYYGRIDKDGSWNPSRRSPDWVAETLRELDTQTLEFVVKYGQRTGNCCFCRRHLETAESVAAGYGPVCAEKYGLPWG